MVTLAPVAPPFERHLDAAAYVKHKQCVRHHDLVLRMGYTGGKGYTPHCRGCYRDTGDGSNPTVGKYDYRAEKEWEVG